MQPWAKIIWSEREEKERNGQIVAVILGESTALVCKRHGPHGWITSERAVCKIWIKLSLD
jgi:hypothetical protein